ncbi:MAG: hypothetical protein HYV24_04605 [Deltaproteobacteria bacterium]|nr:hypothetical protein [Deltaproteobacteria bacterium]
MSFETVRAITDNMRAALESLGLRFAVGAVEKDNATAASMLPAGRISYEGESFEPTHGERPGYSEAEFGITVEIRAGDPAEAVTEEQRWAHAVRGSITVDALNAGGLAATKRVSRVRVPKASVANNKESVSLSVRALVRYRVD